MLNSRKIRLKIAVIGPPNSGKTSFINNLLSKPFKSSVPKTQSYELSIHKVVSSNQEYEVQFWDCGSEHLQYNKHIRRAFFKNCSAALLIFDLSKPEQQWKNDVEQWLQEAYQYDCFLVYAIGTKKDYNIQVNTKVGSLKDSLLDIGELEIFEQTKINGFFMEYQVEHFYQNATEAVSSQIKNILMKIQNDQYKRARGSLAMPRKMDNSIIGLNNGSVIKNAKKNETIASIKEEEVQF